MKKRLFSILLAIIMVASMFTVTVSAADGDSVARIGNKFYNSIQAAINDAKSGDTIVVTKSHNLDCTAITENSLIYVSGDKAITIDLNGCSVTADYTGDSSTYTFVGSFLKLANGSKLVMTDSSKSKRGTLHAKTTPANEPKDTSTQIHYILYNATSDDNEEPNEFDKYSFIVNGGTYKMDYGTINGVSSIVMSTNSHTTLISGGTFIMGNVAVSGSTYGFSPWIFNTSANDANRIYVKGGTFNADINHQHREYEVNVPETKALKNNGDRTWSVEDAVAYMDEYEAWYYGPYTRHVGYTTLENAISAANNTNTYKGTNTFGYEKITLLTDCTVGNTLEIKKDIHINTDGKKIEWTGDLNAPIISVDSGKTLTIPYFELIHKYYTFEGWYKDAALTTSYTWTDKITSDTTLYAKWERKNFTVTYTDGISDVNIFDEKKFTLPYDSDTPEFGKDPSHPDYIFLGWDKPISNKVNGDVTYTAVWKSLQEVKIENLPQISSGSGSKEFTINDSSLDGFVIEYYVNNKWTTTPPSKNGSYDVRITRPADAEHKAFEMIIENGFSVENKEKPKDEEQTNPLSANLVNALGSASRRFVVETTASEGGRVSNSRMLAYGSNFTCIFIPNAGYKIASVTIDDEDMGAINSFTFKNVRESHEISVTFKKIA